MSAAAGVSCGVSLLLAAGAALAADKAIDDVDAGPFHFGAMAIGQAKDLDYARAEGPGIVPTMPLDAYLNGILATLLAQSPVSGVPARVYVRASGDWAAKSTADANIYVALGTLLRLDNEDEIAALLGHEAAHVILGHANADVVQGAQQRALQLSALAAAAQGAVAGKGGKPAANVHGQDQSRALLLNTMLLSPAWSREQERDADRLDGSAGQGRARAAGDGGAAAQAAVVRERARRRSAGGDDRPAVRPRRRQEGGAADGEGHQEPRRRRRRARRAGRGGARLGAGVGHEEGPGSLACASWRRPSASPRSTPTSPRRTATAPRRPFGWRVGRRQGRRGRSAPSTFSRTSVAAIEARASRRRRRGRGAQAGQDRRQRADASARAYPNYVDAVQVRAAAWRRCARRPGRARRLRTGRRDLRRGERALPADRQAPDQAWRSSRPATRGCRNRPASPCR
ncbi:MAG: M48 family metalloprotease [Candidatus Binatia bacterium]